MKRAAAGVFLLLALLVPSALAAPGDKTGNGRPAHGCDQATENDGDPYDSTCDGSPAQNGSGGGNANGRPCAGCVGSADNKNPPGQMPDGSDDNRGYECDWNQGVGQTNPAHTGCIPYSGQRVPAGKKMKFAPASYVAPESEGPTGAVLVMGLCASFLLASFLKTAYRRSLRAKQSKS